MSTLHLKIIILHTCLKALNTWNACPIYYVEYMCVCVEYELYSRHYLWCDSCGCVLSPNQFRFWWGFRHRIFAYNINVYSQLRCSIGEFQALQLIFLGVFAVVDQSLASCMLAHSLLGNLFFHQRLCCNFDIMENTFSFIFFYFCTCFYICLNILWHNDNLFLYVLFSRLWLYFYCCQVLLYSHFP